MSQQITTVALRARPALQWTYTDSPCAVKRFMNDTAFSISSSDGDVKSVVGMCNCSMPNSAYSRCGPTYSWHVLTTPRTPAAASLETSLRNGTAPKITTSSTRSHQRRTFSTRPSSTFQVNVGQYKSFARSHRHMRIIAKEKQAQKNGTRAAARVPFEGWLILFDYFLANSASMAFNTSGSLGLTFVGKRATTLPSRPITNFSKFHLMGPVPAGLASTDVKYL